MNNPNYITTRYQSIEELEKALDGSLTEDMKAALEPKIDSKPYPKHEEALEAFGELVKIDRNQIEGTITDIAKVIIPNEEIPTFPEELFVKFFLPLFSGETPPNEQINLETWLSKVSGDPKLPVDIIDNDGNVLYRVPPIMEDSVIEPLQPNSRSMTLIERQYSRLKEISVQASQLYLQKTLTGLHIKEKPTKEVYENITAWNNIYIRYGMKEKIINLIPLDKVQEAMSEINIENEVESDITDYELDTD